MTALLTLLSALPPAVIRVWATPGNRRTSWAICSARLVVAAIEIGQLDVNDRVVDALIGAAAGGHQGVGDAGQPAEILGDLLGQVGGGGDGRSLRRADEDVVLRLIVLRHEVL